MCWTIDKELFKNNPENYHKVAEKDIIVYKFGKVRDGDINILSYFIKICLFKYTVCENSVFLI